MEEEINALQDILKRTEFTDTLQLYNTTVINNNSPLGVVTTPFDESKISRPNLQQNSNTSLDENQMMLHKNIEPLTSATDRLVNEVRNNLSIVYQQEAQQLLTLLYAPHFQVLFPTHDEVALMREGDLNENNIVDISKNPNEDNIQNVNGGMHEDEINSTGIQTRNIGGTGLGFYQERFNFLGRFHRSRTHTRTDKLSFSGEKLNSKWTSRYVELF